MLALDTTVIGWGIAVLLTTLLTWAFIAIERRYTDVFANVSDAWFTILRVGGLTLIVGSLAAIVAGLLA